MKFVKCIYFSLEKVFMIFLNVVYSAVVKLWVTLRREATSMNNISMKINYNLTDIKMFLFVLRARMCLHLKLHRSLWFYKFSVYIRFGTFK